MLCGVVEGAEGGEVLADGVEGLVLAGGDLAERLAVEDVVASGGFELGRQERFVGDDVEEQRVAEALTEPADAALDGSGAASGEPGDIGDGHAVAIDLLEQEPIGCGQVLGELEQVVGGLSAQLVRIPGDHG